MLGSSSIDAIKRSEAATKIQRIVRGKISRLKLDALKKQQNNAATKIEATYRNDKVRQNLEIQDQSAGARSTAHEGVGSKRKRDPTHLHVQLEVQDEKPTSELKISSDQLKTLKKMFYYFDNDTILVTSTLYKAENGFLYCSLDEQCNKLHFVIDHLSQWENSNFETNLDQVRFISNLLELEPKENIKETAIRHFSNSIPKIIDSYINLIPVFGKKRTDEEYSELFSHIVTIFEHPGMINNVLNQMDVSMCSDNTITTMATLFFSDLDEINLRHATLSNNQFKALVSGIIVSKENVENKLEIRKIILGYNVTCDKEAVMALANKAQHLTKLVLGRNVTCDNHARLLFFQNNPLLTKMFYHNRWITRT